MITIGPNDACPCGWGRKYKKCCGALHGGAPAPSPESLMRSRYTAYVIGNVAYLVATTHPDSPHREANVAAWSDELRRYCAAITFEGLSVRAATERGIDGFVEFEARVRHGEAVHVMQERSSFLKVDGRWLYVAALDGPTPA